MTKYQSTCCGAEMLLDQELEDEIAKIYCQKCRNKCGYVLSSLLD